MRLRSCGPATDIRERRRFSIVRRVPADRMDYVVVRPEDKLLALYEESLDPVFRYASRLTGGHRADTEELVQDAYLVALSRLRRGVVTEMSTGYLIAVCRSRFLDGLRSKGRRQRRESRVATEESFVAVDPIDPSTTEALAALSPEQRAALVLRYVDDLAVSDVARQLGRSLSATESLLSRSRTALRHRLSSEGSP